MTTTYHTAIATGASNSPSTLNTPLGTLDSQLTTVTNEIVTARGSTASLNTRLSILGAAGGTFLKANGAAAAAQKIVTVDSTTGIVAGADVVYALAGGALENNTIGTVDSIIQITLTTNIGTGGIPDDGVIAQVTPDSAAASAIAPYGNGHVPTLESAMRDANQGVYSTTRYGASIGASAAVNRTAIQAAIDAAALAGSGVVLVQGPGTFLIDNALLLKSGVHLEGMNNAVIKNDNARPLDATYRYIMVACSGTVIDASIRNLKFDQNVTTLGFDLNSPCVTLNRSTENVTIEHCRFDNSIAPAIHSATASTTYTHRNLKVLYSTIKAAGGGGISLFGDFVGCRVHGNYIEDSSDHAIAIQNGAGAVATTPDAPYQVAVTSNIINTTTYDAAGAGGRPAGIVLVLAFDCLVANNVIKDTDGGGILVIWSHGTVSTPPHNRRLNITGNIITNTGQSASTANASGIYVNADAAAVAVEFNADMMTIANNTIYNSQEHGIRLRRVHRAALTGNVCTYNEYSGMLLQGMQDFTVVGNLLTDNGRGGGAANNNTSGLVMITDTEDVEDGVISGNRIGNSFDAFLSAHQRIGIVTDVNVNNVMIAHNDLVNNSVAAVALNGSAAKVRDNLGYVTENWGSATLDLVATSGLPTIAHGLSIAPTYATVNVKANTNTEIEVIGTSASIVSCRARDTTTGAIVTTGTLAVTWIAKV